MLDKFIFKTYETLANRNQSEGFQVLFIYANDITDGWYLNLVLFALFMITALGSYFSMYRTRNKGDFSVSFAVAGYVTFITSLLMSLIPNLINTSIVIICFALAVVGSLWMLLSRSTD